ncbi:hypothetical protein F4604DRAFT_1584280, partial [Suillus subluteus]
EFLEKYTTDMDIVLIFSGLFSAVSTSFIAAMESNLSPDPSDTTMALRIQIITYKNLSMSLLTAFGAVLGKQWLIK